MKKFLIIFLSALLVVAIGGFIYLKNFSKKPLPDYNKDVRLKKLNSKVEVYRDKNAVPHIIAKNEEDLFRVAGYIEASDRFWQMDLIRRATQGRLSEIFGKDFFKTDLMLRCLKIDQKSEEIYKNLSNKQKNILNAYADGVNQYIEQNHKKLPFEFKVLGYQPEKWKPQHSLNIVGYIAWDLVMAWSNEIALFKIYNKLDSAVFAQFVPDYSNDQIIYSQINDSLEFNSSIKTMGQNILNLGIVPFMASNNWAINSDKSKSGKPILCNDMHLGYGIPGIWYQMHLIVEDELNLTGVTIPGAPGIIVGHNDSIAWGMTNVMLDGTDFYLETLNEDSTKYLLNGEWKDLIIEKEKIITKKGDTLIGQIKYTHRGPIISKFKDLNKALSMHWIGYEPSNEFAGIYLINRATNWPEFRKGASNFGSISQNMIYADINGNIGLQLTGTIPVRKASGYFVFPGDTTKYDWNDYIDFDSLPYEYNPKRGYIVSANNKSSKNVDYYITQYFFQDFRYRRISQLLEAKDKLTVEDMKVIQNDQYSVMVKDILPEFIFEVSKLNLDNPNYKKSLKILTNWDGNMKAKSIAPLIFEQFNFFFVQKTIEDNITKKVYQDFNNCKILMNNMILNLFNNKESVLFDDINTDKNEKITDIIKIAYQMTLDTLEAQLGSNIENWQYQKMHNLTLKHPLSKVKILNFFFNLNRGPYGVGGSNHTVAPYNFVQDDNFKVVSGASQRHIYSLFDWDKSFSIIPTGQSGVPSSKYYCNQTEKFISGKYYKDYFDKQTVIDNAVFKMIFKKK